MEQGVVPVGMGVPSLAIMSVLFRLGGAVGVSLVVGGLKVFWDVACAEVIFGITGPGEGGRGGPGGGLVAAGGGGRLVDLEISLSSSLTWVVRVAIFSTRAGSLWDLVGCGGGALAAASSPFIRWESS